MTTKTVRPHNTHLHDAEHSGSVDRALDWGSKGSWFETQISHCIEPLSKILDPLSSCSTQEDRNQPDMTTKTVKPHNIHLNDAEHSGSVGRALDWGSKGC